MATAEIDTITGFISPSMHDGELRILDTDLAARLGFDRPRKIRELIRRHLPSLEEMGRCPTVGRRPEAGGHAVSEYYLNKKQAIFITAKSETKIATEVTIEIIERFDAYERGEMPHPQIPRTLSEALQLAADQARQIESMAPKAEALDLISASEGDLGVRDAGRELKVGERWVTATILARNWACKQGRKLRPAHYGLMMGYVRLCARVYRDRNTGETCVADDFKITRKGVGRLGELIVAKRLSNVEAV